MSIDSNQLYTGMDNVAGSLKATESQPSDIIAFNNAERALISRFFEAMGGRPTEATEEITAIINDLEQLSGAISRYPSMYEQSTLLGEQRSISTLIDALCRVDECGKILFLPTKAILGQGFLVAKFHAFAAISKVAKTAGFADESVAELRQATVNVMFTLMAEDVYMSLLNDSTLRGDIRHDVAEALTELWERRLDARAARVAPVLDAIWTARRRIVPSFGTMIGTSELLMLSIELDESWTKFIAERIAEPDVSAAMEEFIFGLSFEDISLIRRELRNRRQAAISKDEVERIIGHETESKTEEDPRVFYQAYSKRRSNANARKKMALNGPWKTLEDHYMQFIIEKNREQKAK